MSMPPLRVQGRIIEPAHLEQIRRLLADNPSWGRSRLSIAICQLWDWKDGAGRYKDMACRTMLVKLQTMGLIVLPPRMTPGRGSRLVIGQAPDHCTCPLTAALGDIAPITIYDARSCRDHSRLFASLVSTHHYLGFRDVGRNMKYLAFDRHGRPVGCLLFGSAAWKAQPRDLYIGWDAQTRAANLHLLANNTRFLIPPWVGVPHLASHLLARVSARLPGDWMQRYGYRPAMLETFVDRSRFAGTCYRAANWICVGQTKGRSRQDRYTKLKLPIKDIYLYPLRKDFARCLNQTSFSA
jgi:hypothetical protein